MAQNLTPEHDDSNRPETKIDRAEKRAANAFMSDQEPKDRESLIDRQLEAESQDQSSRKMTPEEAATRAKRGEKVVGDATKALGFSLGIEKNNNDGTTSVLLPGRTPDEVKALEQAENKQKFPFDPEQLQGQETKTRFVPAGTPLEIKGHKYALNELSANAGNEATKPEQSTANNKIDVIAQDVEFPMRLPTPILSAQDLGFTKESLGEMFRFARNVEHSIKHPFRGHISTALAEIPPGKWSDAYAAFPQFKEANLSEKQITELMKGIVRNELFFYDFADGQDDKSVKTTGKPIGSPLSLGPQRKAEDATLGYSQVSAGGVEKFEQEYPRQMSQFAGKETNSLLDPSQAPIMVAAVLCHNLEMYKRHNVPISEKALAYGFNPDVSENGKKQTLPSPKTLEKSEHVANVMRQIGIVRHQISPKTDEL